MADDHSDWTVQLSPYVGKMMVNVRGTDVPAILKQYDEILAGLKERGLEQAPAEPAPTHEQAVQNVQTQLGGTPVTGGTLPKPAAQYPGGDGDLHTSKSCPVCGAPLKIQEKLTKAGDRWYRKLECSADYKHTNGKDPVTTALVWSEDWKKRRS